MFSRLLGHSQTHSNGEAAPDTHDEFKDLGFGSEVTKKSQKRLLNKDGSFNIKRKGYSFLCSNSLYQYLVTISWPAFFNDFVVAYLLLNLSFATLYFSCGPEALLGHRAETEGARFLSAFFFSVQTLATIGYGGITPNGLLPNLIVTVESIIGLLGVALATGICFARFSRPSAKIRYSKNAIIAPYKGITAFQFRVINERANQIMNLDARLVLAKNVEKDGVTTRPFFDLPLERTRIMFFPLNWTVVHPIDEKSPLYGMTKTDLENSNAEFMVLFTGTDDTFSQTVHSWSSYKTDELVWGAKFVNIFEYHEDGSVEIDLNRNDEIIPAQLPAPEAVNH